MKAKKKAQKKLKRLEKELKSQKESQRMFIRSVSHSLKNSLGLVNNFASIALRDRDEMEPAELTDALETISRNGQMALYIIDELRLWGSHGNGDPFELESCQLAGIIDRVIQHSDDLVHFSRAEIEQTVVDLIIPGHRKALEEVILNVLTLLLRRGERPNHVTIQAFQHDTELEIAFQGKFERPLDLTTLFVQPADRPVQTDGYGLGMPVAQALMKRMNGEIICERPDEKTLSCRLLFSQS